LLFKTVYDGLERKRSNGRFAVWAVSQWKKGESSLHWTYWIEALYRRELEEVPTEHHLQTPERRVLPATPPPHRVQQLHKRPPRQGLAL